MKVALGSVNGCGRQQRHSDDNEEERLMDEERYADLDYSREHLLECGITTGDSTQRR
jgi:hypothetical protein